MHFLKLASRVRPAIRQFDGARIAPRLGQGVIASIAVNLQRAAGSLSNRVCLFAATPIDVTDHNTRCR